MQITANRFECITCILAAGLSILEEWTPFALTKVGISGDDLWTSAKKCTLLFRRNLILGLLSSSLSRILVFSSILGICCCSGIAVGYISSFSMHNYLSVAMGGIAAIIPFYMLRLAGQIITHTMDCTFICYLLDMDSNTCHCSVAHRLFAQTQQNIKLQSFIKKQNNQIFWQKSNHNWPCILKVEYPVH